MSVLEVVMGSPWSVCREAAWSTAGAAGVPLGDGGDLVVRGRGPAGVEREDVLLALDDGQGHVDPGRLGQVVQPGGVVEQRLGTARGEVEPGEAGEVGVQRVRQRMGRAGVVAEDAGDHAREQLDADERVGGVVGHQRLALVLHVEPRGQGDDRTRQRRAALLERQSGGDGEVPPGGVPDRRDVPRGDPGLGERQERGDGVLQAGGMRVLGRPAVVEDEGMHAQRLGDVGRELAVAGSRTDRETAAVGVEQHLGGVGPDRTAPDAGDAADDLLGIGHVRRLRGGLVPLVEDAPEQPHGEVRRAGHDLRPVGVEILERVLLDRCDRLLNTHDIGSFLVWLMGATQHVRRASRRLGTGVISDTR
jgi:hypothetical protein